MSPPRAGHASRACRRCDEGRRCAGGRYIGSYGSGSRLPQVQNPAHFLAETLFASLCVERRISESDTRFTAVQEGFWATALFLGLRSRDQGATAPADDSSPRFATRARIGRRWRADDAPPDPACSATAIYSPRDRRWFVGPDLSSRVASMQGDIYKSQVLAVHRVSAGTGRSVESCTARCFYGLPQPKSGGAPPS